MAYTALERISWTLSASATSGADPLVSSVDGSNASRWATGAVVVPSTTFFKVNLGVAQSFERIILNNSSFTGDHPASGNVQVSDDDVTYATIATWSAAAAVAGVLTIDFTPVTKKYIKLVATATPAIGTNWWSIGEINVHSQALTFTALATAGWTPSANRSDASSPPASAIDGSSASRWATGGAVLTASDFFKIDMGAMRDLSRFVINNLSFTGDSPQTGTVEISGDNVTWAQVATWTTAGNITSRGALHVNWTSVSTRYVRLKPTSLPAVAGNWWSIGEIALFTTTSTARSVNAVIPVPWRATATATHSVKANMTARLPYSFTGVAHDPHAVAFTGRWMLGLSAALRVAHALDMGVQPLRLGLTANIGHVRTILATMRLPFRGIVTFDLAGPTNASTRTDRQLGTPTARQVIGQGGAAPTTRGGRGFGTPTPPE